MSSKSEQTIDMENLNFKDLQRQLALDLLKKEGDFLLRRGTNGGIILSVHAANNEIAHFKFAERQREYRFPGGPGFHTLQELLTYYYRTGKQLFENMKAKLLNPIYADFKLIDPNCIKLDKQLEAGNFGQVWRAKLTLKGQKEEVVAVKILLGDSSEKDRQECLAEGKIMHLLEHENVVRLKGLSFNTTADGSSQLQIILEYCNAGSLDKLLEEDNLSEEGKTRALLDAVKGMEYLHMLEVIHRDIASRNCLVNKAVGRTVVKIAGFGLTRMAPDHYWLVAKRKLPVFSMSPESLLAREWTRASDVWSFGILMQEVYNKGRNPYEHYFSTHKMDVHAVIKYFIEGNRLDPPSGMPDELAEIAKKCMQKHTQRPTMEQVAKEIESYYNTAYPGH